MAAGTPNGTRKRYPQKSRAKPGGYFDRLTWTARQILDDGSLADKRTGCRIWQRGTTAAGYGRVTWRGSEYYCHRLSWADANGQDVPAGMSVCHRCDTPRCIEPSHLFIGTPADNTADMCAKGRQARGSALGSAKFTAAEIIEIREAREKHIRLAEKYGTTKNYIWHIKAGRRWGHL